MVETFGLRRISMDVRAVPPVQPPNLNENLHMTELPGQAQSVLSVERAAERSSAMERSLHDRLRRVLGGLHPGPNRPHLVLSQHAPALAHNRLYHRRAGNSALIIHLFIRVVIA